MATGTSGPGPGLPHRVAAGAGRAGTDVGAGLGSCRGDLDSHPGRGGRAVTLPGAPARGRADLDALDAALGELRAAGWPAPEDPDSGEDTELDGRDSIAGRLSEEVSWLRQCADWLAHLDADSYPPTVNLRPAADWPDRAVVAVDLARVRAVIDRIAADIDELARARRVQDLSTAAVLPDPQAERRRRLAEPDLEFRAFWTRRRLPPSRPVCITRRSTPPTACSPMARGPRLDEHDWAVRSMPSRGVAKPAPRFSAPETT
jgi:hypothetical protein